MKPIFGIFFSLAFAFNAAFSLGMGMDMSMLAADESADAHACCPGGAPEGTPEKSDSAPSCCLFAPGAAVGAVSLNVPASSSRISLGASEFLFGLSSRGEFLYSAPSTGPPSRTLSPSSPRAPPLV